MKKLNVLTRMLLLVALLVGSTSVWATDGTFTISIGSFTNLPTSGNATYGNYSWTASGISGIGQICANSSSTYMQMNGDNANGKIIYNTTPIAGTLKKINIVKDSGSNREYSVYGRTTAYTGTGDYGTLIATANITDGDGRDYTVSTGSYNYFVIKINATKAAYLASITVTYEEESASAETTSITIDDSGITNTDVFTSTDAGSLSAVVKDESDNEIDGAVVTWSSSAPNVATIDENTGEVTLVGKGSTTITANYSGVSGTYKASLQNYVLNVTSSNPVVTIDLSNTLFGISAGNNGVEQTKTVDGITIKTGCSSSAGTKTNYQPNHIRFYKDSYLTLTAPTGYVITRVQLNRYSDDTWYGDKVTPSEGSFAETNVDTAPLVWSGNVSEVTFSYAGQCRTASVEVTLAKVLEVEYADGWMSYVTPCDILFPNNVEAFIVTSTETSLTREKITRAPKDTPLVLHATEGAKTYNLSLDANVTSLSNNELKASDGSILINDDNYKKIYVLTVSGDIPGFGPLAKGKTLAKGKVYLEFADPQAKDFITFIEEETDGIKAVSTKVENGVRYNLAGQKVGADYKGIVIVNGKKMLNK